MKTIGNYEARTHWSELLQDVKSGQHYVILHKGEPIAEISPPRTENRQLRSKHAAGKLLAFMDSRSPISVDIKTLINDGRD